MKIAYSNKRLLTHLIFGIFWIGLGLFYFFEGHNSKLSIYTTITAGMLFILMYAYEYSGRYIEITDKKVIVNTIPKKEIISVNLIWVNHFADDYIMKNSDMTLRIEKSKISKRDLPKFESFFNQLDSELKQGTAL